MPPLKDSMATDAEYRRLGMRIFADFSGSIAVPAVLAAILGKWLDKKFDSTPNFLSLCLIIAFILTGFTVYKKAKYYSAKYQALNDSEPKS